MSKLVADGSNIVQVGRDIKVTTIIINQPESKNVGRKVSIKNRQKIALRVSEINKLEEIETRIIRGILNRSCNVASLEEMSDETAIAAITYLDGWLACINEEKQSDRAMIAQIIRIWNVINNKLGIETTAQNLFGTSTLTNLNYWQLRCLLAYAVATWKVYWGNKK